jgi:hypothetical protein
MDELLKKLLAAEVLTEETKTELEAAFKGQLDEAIQKARADAQATVTAELNEAWLQERDTLIEALDAKVTEALTEELSELRTDIESFRDLEAEYASKLVESKGEMSIAVKADIAQLIEKLDSFLEVRLVTEMEELREDIAVVKKNEFGKKVFESFVAEFKKHYAGDDSLEGKLEESQQQLSALSAQLDDANKKAAKLERSIKLEKVLAPLTGRTKEVMEAILKNVDTALLEDAYKTYVGRVLKETSDKDGKTSEKEEKVLAEETKTEVITGVAKTGDTATTADEQKLVTEHVHSSTLSEADRTYFRQMAGFAA